MSQHQRTHDSYSVGIICALPLEKAAVIAMLDEEHTRLPNVPGDENEYTLGRVGQHNVAVACLPAGITGKASAAIVAAHIMRSFPIKIGLMVGIGGGVPSKNADIRLGDVVVSQPAGTHGGVVQWDFGKMERSGTFRRTGTLNKPPRALLHALSSLQSQHLVEGPKTQKYLREMLSRWPNMKTTFAHQGSWNDRLFRADYDHVSGETCDRCDEMNLVSRRPREDETEVKIHYGNIASGDEVMKDGTTRDRVAAAEEVICFEMEAAGLTDGFPCLVIRGICDYADSHKNKRWQPYAAAAAASYAKELLGVIEQVGVDELRPANNRPYHITFSLQGIPVARNFVGRKTELEQLRHCLSPPTSELDRRKTFVIEGLGGMGKTQLSVEFARQCHESYSAVFWLNGSSKERLQQSFIEAARRIPAEQLTVNVASNIHIQDADADLVMKDVLQWLSAPANRYWLLIIDNVDRVYPQDDQSYDIKDILPYADQGAILVTTRLSSLTRLGSSLQLGQVDDNHAKEILEWEAGVALRDSEVVIRRLSGLPLALTHAGAYIRMTGMSVLEYSEYYDKTWAELIAKQDGYRLQEYSEYGLMTTWMISYEQVARQNLAAASLLKFWALLSSDDLFYELITSAVKVRRSLAIPSWLATLAESKLEFTDAIGVLSAYSLIDSRTRESGFSMHSVLHRWCLSVLTKEETRLFHLLCVCMIAAIVPLESEKFWTMDRRLLPHILQLECVEVELEHKSKNQLYYRSWVVIGGLCSRQRYWPEAEKAYNRVLCIRGTAQSPDDRLVFDTLKSMARLYCEMERFDMAEQVYTEILTSFTKTFGPDDLSTLAIVNNLGFLYFRMGRNLEAEQLLERALRGTEKVLSPDHMSILNTLNNLCLVYRVLSKPEEAERMGKRALEGKERVLGQEHASTLDTVYNLGFVYHHYRRWDEAERMYMRALKGYENAFGSGHEATLEIMDILSDLYTRMERWEDAKCMSFRALEGRENALRTDATPKLSTLRNLGYLYRVQGRLVEAENMYIRALTGRDKMLGPAHALTMSVARLLSSLYLRMAFVKRQQSRANLTRLDPRIGKALPKSNQEILSGCVRLCQQYPDSSMYGNLGRMLLWFRSEDLAIVAFEQQIEVLAIEDLPTTAFEPDLEPFDDRLVHISSCDGCGGPLNLQTGRLICRICEDVDLCRDCHNKYKFDDIKVGDCQDHSFLQIPRDEWQTAHHGTVSPHGGDLAAWLENLKTSE